MIKNSLEWSNVGEVLRHKVVAHVHTLENRQQIIKMINNISDEITILSKAEVMARRGHKNVAKDILSKVNNDIVLVEEYILVAALIG